MDVSGIPGCKKNNLSDEEKDLRVSRLISSLYSSSTYPTVRSIGVQAFARTSSKTTQTPTLLKSQCTGTSVLGPEEKDLRVSPLMSSLYSSSIHPAVRSIGVQTFAHTYSKTTQTPSLLKSLCGKNTSSFICPRCGLILASELLLKEHQEDKHVHREGHNRCRFCKYSSHCRGNVKVHERTHTGEKPNVCKVCLKAFVSKAALERHLRTIHEGERKHECSICGFAFTQKIHLQEHERVHSDERPFKCEQCGKAFALKCNLRTHLRLHSHVKPYSCTFCGKSFTQLSHMKCHTVTVHTKDFPHRCHLCQKGFYRPALLKKHLQKKHGSLVCIV